MQINRYGWGYITGEDGQEYFFDESEVISKKPLEEGQRVSFICCTKASINRRGGPHALRIREVWERRSKPIKRSSRISGSSGAFDLSGNFASWDDD